jgi:hypothetical protein
MGQSPSLAPLGPLSDYWENVVALRLRGQLQKWETSFDSWDDARLIRKSMLRECGCQDINRDVWADFLKNLLYQDVTKYPFEAIDTLLTDDKTRSYYFLPGFKVEPPSDGRLFHYVRLDRFNEQSLGFTFRGDQGLGSLTSEISRPELPIQKLGLEGLPVWVTDGSLSSETRSDTARNRLGLRSLHKADLSIVEVEYAADALKDGVRAPTGA